MNRWVVHFVYESIVWPNPHPVMLLRVQVLLLKQETTSLPVNEVHPVFSSLDIFADSKSENLNPFCLLCSIFTQSTNTSRKNTVCQPVTGKIRNLGCEIWGFSWYSEISLWFYFYFCFVVVVHHPSCIPFLIIKILKVSHIGSAKPNLDETNQSFYVIAPQRCIQ